MLTRLRTRPPRNVKKQKTSNVLILIPTKPRRKTRQQIPRKAYPKMGQSKRRRASLKRNRTEDDTV